MKEQTEQPADTYLVEQINDINKMIGNCPPGEEIPLVFSDEYIQAVYAAWDDFRDMEKTSH